MLWKEEYETGVERIDDQHKMLFKISEDYRIALDEGNGKRVYAILLRILEDYATAHFKFEEGCMNLYKCPAGQRNKDAHTTFLHVITRYQKQYSEKGFQTETAVELLDLLENWLDSHICKVDIHLKKCVSLGG